jgi:hypothetical protein
LKRKSGEKRKRIYERELTVFEQIVTLILASFAICSLIPNVSCDSKPLFSFLGHLARQDREDVPPLCPHIITWDISFVI